MCHFTASGAGKKIMLFVKEENAAGVGFGVTQPDAEKMSCNMVIPVTN